MVAWTAPRELEVRYTRGVKPIRAETTWKEFTINYVEADIGSGKPRS
jgi:hypothetical protein